MGVATHLGIRLSDYDARIRTFIPRYDEMLAAAAASLDALDRHAPLIVDLGTGTGALAARCLAARPKARIIGVDADRGMLALAERRLRGRLMPVTEDFLATTLPRCDAVTASFALHHVPTRRRKAALYGRCFAALRPGGILVNADCCVASSRRLEARDREAWRAHLERRYERRRAEGFLKAWAEEDVYLSLTDEIGLLQSAGFTVDVPWRQDAFAVIVGSKLRNGTSH
jgi:SAM-dependent methyltransferase